MKLTWTTFKFFNIKSNNIINIINIYEKIDLYLINNIKYK